MLKNTIITVLVAMLVSTQAFGADAKKASAAPKAQAKAPAKPAVTTPAKVALKKPPVSAMVITVVSVTGIASKCDASQAVEKWTPLKKGDLLGERMLIRTGMGSNVELKFADRGKVVVTPCTMMGIRQFSPQGTADKLVKTRIGVKYGAINAKVDSSRGANDFRVKTPVATFAVRGTGGGISHNGGFGTSIKGTSGKWAMGSGLGKRGVRAGEQGNDKLTPSIKLTKDDRDTLAGGDPNGGQTKEELKYAWLFGDSTQWFNQAGVGAGAPPRGKPYHSHQRFDYISGGESTP